jgi:hypothetical protein
MASLIDPSKPTAGNALTSDVRANFAAAKTEIEELQSGTSIADGSITDAKIGTRTPEQALNAVAGAGTLLQIISWFANIIKSISGETNWYNDPAVSLKSHVANANNPHTVTYQQLGITDALAAKTTPAEADLIPLLDSAGAPPFVMKKLSFLNMRTVLIAYASTIFGTPFDNAWAYCGECLIDQQAVPGTPYVIVAGAGAAYTIDGWLASCTGANVNVNRQAVSANGFQSAIRVTGAALVTGVTLKARCQSEDAAHFANRATKLLFWTRNTNSLPVTWTLSYANAVDNFAAVTQIATGTVNPTDVFTKFIVDIPSNANTGNGLELKFTVGALVAGTWEISGIDQIYGAVDRAYPHLTAPAVLIRAQHFYFYTPSMALGYTTSATNLYSGQLPFPVTMHRTPTIVAAVSSYTVSVGAAGTPAIAAGAGFAASPDAVCLSNSGAGWNVNAAVAFTGAFDARL